MSPEKQFIREVAAQTWIKELKERAEAGNFESWNDIIQESDYQKVFEEYFGNLDYFKNKEYLDIGAGFGGTLHELAKKLGAKLKNVDISPEAIEFFKKQGEEGIVADVYDLPLEDNSIDGVISTNFLNTSAIFDKEDLEDVLGEIYRVLKEKGHFIQSHYGDMKIPFSREEQLEMLESVGFKNIKILENKVTSEIMHQAGFSEDFAFIAEK